MGMTFFILAEIGYRGAQVFYDALLVDVATPETIGDVSGKGWAIGSIGGVVCLGIVLAMIKALKVPVEYSFLSDSRILPPFCVTHLFMGQTNI